MPAMVAIVTATLHQIDELVAKLDKGVARPFRAQIEIKDLAVKGERFVDVADFEGDMVDADKTRLVARGGVRLGGLGHCVLLLSAAAHPLYIGRNSPSSIPPRRRTGGSGR